MPFEKGKKKTGGRRKGVENKTTKEAKAILEKVLLNQVDNIEGALNDLKSNDSGKYIDACSKLFTYVLPRKTDITTDDEPLQIIMPRIIIE